jgi:hypothetical protein
MRINFTETATPETLRQALLRAELERNGLTQQVHSLRTVLRASKKAPKPGRTEDIQSVLNLTERRLGEVKNDISRLENELNFSLVLRGENNLIQANNWLGRVWYKLNGGDIELE